MDHQINKYFSNSLQQVKKIILQQLGDENVKIILFGSAARGDYHRYSDIDVAILPKNSYDKKKFILLKEQLEDLNIPYSVELVDLSNVSKKFKDKVFKEGEIWKK